MAGQAARDAAAASQWSSVAWRALCLVLIVLAALVPVGWLNYGWYGEKGVWAAVIAAGICLAGGLVSLATPAVLGGPNRGLYALAAQLAFLFGLPLVAGIVLDARGGPLAEAGVFRTIVWFFLVTLTAETVLVVSLLKEGQPARKKPADASETKQAEH